MSYISPITVAIATQVEQFKNDVGDSILKEVKRIGVDVDKIELISALKYDRDQYDKGFSDGQENGRKEAAKYIICYFKSFLWSFGSLAAEQIKDMLKCLKERFGLEVDK